MSLGQLGKTIVSERETTSQQATQEIESQWGEIPAKIIEFFPETQTAKVQPLYMPDHNGENVEMIPIEEVPVRFDRCAAGGLTYPLLPNDVVLLRPQMRSTERYHTEGVHIANDRRSFSLSDMEAYIDGGESLTSPIENFDPLNLHLRFGQGGIFGLHASLLGQMKVEMLGGELLTILIDAFEALSNEPVLVNRSSYASAAQLLRASRIL